MTTIADILRHKPTTDDLRRSALALWNAEVPWANSPQYPTTEAERRVFERHVANEVSFASVMATIFDCQILDFHGPTATSFGR